jgi:hypothetical protein
LVDSSELFHALAGLLLAATMNQNSPSENASIGLKDDKNDFQREEARHEPHRVKSR